MKRFLYYTLCILGVLTTTNAGAASPFNLLPDRGDAYLSFYLDNDLFAGTDAPETPPGESPYAGWLGLGFSLHAKDSCAINSVELSIGTVGLNSQAREVQDFIQN